MWAEIVFRISLGLRLLESFDDLGQPDSRKDHAISWS